MDDEFQQIDSLKKDIYELIRKILYDGGRLNIYMVEDQETIEEKMEYFISKGMFLETKRVVHGYSKSKSMYSLQYRRDPT